MTTSFWQERLTECPALRPWLEKAARYAANSESLPATLTLGDTPESKDVRRALEALFPGCREENGRLKARLDASQRDPAKWRPLAQLLGVKPAAAKPAAQPGDRFPQTVLKLKVLFPGQDAFIEALRRSEPLQRYFKTSASAPDDLIALVEAIDGLRAAQAGITLSELGAKHFNDSKALRSGPLRQQLEQLLRLKSGDRDSDSASLLNAFGIIENPYTTHAVIFAPFAYRATDGEWLDWPHRLWRRGEAAILSWRTVRTIAEIRAEEPFTLLVSSENAAPFHRLVEMRRAALYTEGYPNAAVKTLLRHFAQKGFACLHWGDTDLDGYRIAEQVAGQISSRMYSPPAADPELRGHLLRLTAAQRQRVLSFLDDNPSFAYRGELRQSLALGWLEQEQTLERFT